MTTFRDTVRSEEELREIIGHPSKLVRHKVIDHLDEQCRKFIACSPLLFVSSSDEHGNCDVSPRGDAPGFVHILDEKCMVIPERPGNRRIDTMRNILSNPKIGLIFVIQGLEETLRINGRASITKEEPLLSLMQVNGKSPLLGIGVVVEECFVHCAKAFKRSQLWDQKAWLDRGQLPNPAKMLSAHAKTLGITEQDISTALHESYTKRLY
ncbi:pyridoxamine 5'-phosphate oxidase family protein [Paenibacillus sp. SC116]|uniref:pyridoxamine 5'-phosphate oxidase family protein n=1 Tax=Paenibacillus sp. SC116 TaxID=2968986 RepID=UPI00215ABA7E|nr:pyridoxamine 5'-phosphate oxidase family protein [Paenibacillus sp. SC116]MCR8843297.1 pyridoxamine 5'-phosphate oxidase family protein [Paenibacillus sp. SC116]